MDYAAEALEKHREWKGKIQTRMNYPVEARDDLSNACIPDVAEPCKEISKNVDKSCGYMCRGNIMAVTTDGTAVLGLGDVGPEARMPVMRGKAILFKAPDGVGAIPLCVRSKDINKTARTVELLVGSSDGINLEDIATLRCFEIERRLKESPDVPVSHGDQHGTTTVVGAALINALKVTKKEIFGVYGVVNGAGSAGIACAKLLLSLGVKNLILCDHRDTVYEGEDWLSPTQAEMTKITNREHTRGTLADIVRGTGFFLDIPAPNCMSAEMIESMAQQPVVSTMANPMPEIFPDEALAVGAVVVGTGRSDHPNQISNLLTFSGILRDAFDIRIKGINDEMKLATVFAIAGMIPEGELLPKYIIPSPLDKHVMPGVVKAMAGTTHRTNVARI